MHVRAGEAFALARFEGCLQRGDGNWPRGGGNVPDDAAVHQPLDVVPQFLVAGFDHGRLLAQRGARRHGCPQQHACRSRQGPPGCAGRFVHGNEATLMHCQHR